MAPQYAQQLLGIVSCSAVNHGVLQLRQRVLVLGVQLLLHGCADATRLTLKRSRLILYAVCVRRFIPYLKKIFDLGSTDRVWVEAAGEYPNLLDAETEDLLGYTFVDSTTDVAVIKGSAIRYDKYLEDMLTRC